MLRYIFLSILLAVCSGQQYNKDPNPVTTEIPTEPQWVTLLRNNIKTAVKYQGYNNAKDSIKAMINNADQQINRGHNLRNKESVNALRSITDGTHANNNINNMNEQPQSLRSKWEPRWEKDLKNYVKGLIGQYGKSHLDNYVRPVVSAVETSNNVVIRDIDVNPYGEVSVNWKGTKEEPNTRSGYDEFQGRPEQHQFIN